jgi:hypothetical protein
MRVSILDSLQEISYLMRKTMKLNLLRSINFSQSGWGLLDKDSSSATLMSLGARHLSSIKGIRSIT